LTGGIRQRSDVGGRKSEIRDQRSEVRGRKSEVGSRRSGVRGQGSEVGGLEGESATTTADKKMGLEEYPADYYVEFLEYVKEKYKGQYWHVLTREMARFWKNNYPQITQIYAD